MKFILVLLFIIFFLLLSPVFPQQKKILEEVSVDWWVVPVFVVDKSGQPVLDLKKSDIELKVDNKKIKTFALVKRSFTVSEQPTEEEKERADVSPAPERKKNVFLLFDTALSTTASTDAAKVIAQRMINQAKPDTRFFIMTIEPFAGLTYAGGETGDKKKLMDIIKKKVKGKPNSRVPDPEEVVVQIVGAHAKYGPEDAPFLRGSASKYYKRKSKSFAQSFESLYYALNTIKDNKFVYLFTEGISNALQEAESGDRSMYQQYLKEMAEYLGRSGAVLFIINPFGVLVADRANISGEDSLRFLSQKSGGKYLEGSDKKLMAKIESLNRAYYELAFPAVPKSKQGILRISLHPKRKDIEVHTLKTTEKSRQYSQMKTMEQEVLALNLVSGNPLYKIDVSSQPAEIIKESRKKKRTTYQVNIPDGFLNRSLDLYKVWTNPSDIRVEKESLRANKKRIKITFKNVNPNDETFFALISGEQKSALVMGMKQEKQETYAFGLPKQTEEWATKELMEKEKQTGKLSKTIELEELLRGAAQYCEKLKKAAFHYLCKEKIVETQKPLAFGADTQSDVASQQNNMFYARASGWVQREIVDQTKIQKNEYNYRLKKLGDRVREEREVRVENTVENETPPPVIIDINDIRKSIRFLSSKAVFGPITLLDARRQNKYHFRLLGYQKLKDRPTAIIEAYPKNEKDSQFIYGKIWIDREDFSVLKIKANPNSILGYDKLEKLAEELNTRLFLDLETEFFKYRDGIRFPTQIHFKEGYKGGLFIRQFRGSRKWTRTDNLTTYSDYLFFNVDMDVVYQ
ncbi:MAG: hypothetical protein PVH61_26615 [Candidatus Aminicenantes bacterium]|jgi:VWFA-related protein